MGELRYVQLRAPTHKEQVRFAEADLHEAYGREQVRNSGDDTAVGSGRNRFASPLLPDVDAGARRMGPQGSHPDLRCHPRHSQLTQSTWQRLHGAVLGLWQRSRQWMQRTNQPAVTNQARPPDRDAPNSGSMDAAE